MQAGRAFTIEEVEEVAARLGIDFSLEEFDVEELLVGMTVELEHGSADPLTDVTHDDPLLTAKLALAHLRERPDFYRLLAEAEEESLPFTREM